MEGWAEMRAFVVEDDPDLRDSIAGVLEIDGWAVQVAEDGIAALGCIHRTTPDLIVLDLLMPNLGGLEVLKLLRSTDRGRRIPVIVVTGAQDTRGVDRLASAILSKPIDPGELMQKVQMLTGAAEVPA